MRLSGTGHVLVSRLQPEHSTVQRRSLQGVARKAKPARRPHDVHEHARHFAVHSRQLSKVQTYHAQTFGLDHQTGLTWLQQDGFNKMASTICLGHDLIGPGAACGGEWSWRTRSPASAHAPGPYSWHPASRHTGRQRHCPLAHFIQLQGIQPP